MKLILFDCDGTLVDSAAVTADCMGRTFVEAGLPAPGLAATKTVIGLTLHIAIARLLGREADDAAIALADRYRHHFLAVRAEPGFREPLYDGISDLIADLGRRDDIVLGIVTGKSRRGVKAIFETHGFGAHFAAIRTADDCPSKPHPAMVEECCAETGIRPDSTIVVGDAIYDMQMARAAGARGVGVAWGYHDAAALVIAGAHAVITSPADLHAHLES